MEEQIARELCMFIQATAEGVINAGPEYAKFLRENPPLYKDIIRGAGGIKSFCSRYPNYLEWQDYNGPGKGLIALRIRFPGLGPIAPVEEVPVAAMSKEVKRAMERAVIPDPDMDVAAFSWMFNYVANRTARLHGISTFAETSFVSIRESLRRLLTDSLDPRIREVAHITEIRVLVARRPTFPDAMVFFSVLLVHDLYLTDLIFTYLTRSAIPKGFLVVAGNRVTSLECPYSPNTSPDVNVSLIPLIPYVLGSLRNKEYFKQQGAAFIAVPHVRRPSDEEESPTEHEGQSVELRPNGIRSPVIARVVAPPPVPPVLPPDIDINALRPEPYGHLENGIRSPVVAPALLQQFIQQQESKFDLLKDRVAHHGDSLIGASRLQCHWSDQGTVVFVRHNDYKLGSGSEADVYIGGFLEGEQASDELEVIKSNFGEFARPVAVKRYKSRESSLEIGAYRAMRLSGGVDGILVYIDHFEMDDDIYVVQELGVIDLSKFNSQGGIVCDPVDRLKIVRACCLAVKELHTRSSGGILHCDIRPPNFLLMSDGSLKICDFGVSRVLPSPEDNHFNATFKRILLRQPVEVLNMMEDIMRRREELDKRGEVELDPTASRVNFSFSGDIFMLGLVLFKIVTNNEALTEADIRHRREVNLSSVETCCSGGKLLAHLIGKMLSHDHQLRPTIDQILAHPFFCSWNENKTIVETLHKDLHTGGSPQWNESFRFIQDIFTPMEGSFDWSAKRDELPPLIREVIVNSRNAPRLHDVEWRPVGPHPLPNMHQCIQWLRHFFIHFADPKSLVHFYRELEAFTNGDRALGSFIYLHPAICWILPTIWDYRVQYERDRKLEKSREDQAWEDQVVRNDQRVTMFRLMEQRMRSLFSGH